jgi:hypothetical protein
MQDRGPSSVESALQQSESRWFFFTPRELAVAWRGAFDEAASSVPEPFWLYSDDERTPLVLGFPLHTTPAWDALARAIGALIEEETERLVKVAQGETAGSALPPERTDLTQRLASMVENALVNSHGRRYTEILWLALSREISRRIADAMRGVAGRFPALGSEKRSTIRYDLARRLSDVAHRAEAEAFSYIRRWGDFPVPADTARFARFLREDLMPFAERRLTVDLGQLDAWVRGVHDLDPVRFRRNLQVLIDRVDRLLRQDQGFVDALRLINPEAEKLSPEARVFSSAVLDLLTLWPNPDTPRLPRDTDRLLRKAGGVLRRFEVIVALRDRIYPVQVQGTRTTTVLRRRPVALSQFTRPLDFTAPGVVDSAVRRYGLLYDLVEFTSLLEVLRRRGRSAEEKGLLFMAEFHRAIESIRVKYRLRFEKFLGDGAFYTARSPEPVIRAAAELRIAYEQLKEKGFPFDRGLRSAVNVGTYHLLPLSHGEGERPSFEFFGHSLVELVRLTSGKTTHDAEEIADFLIASGYDVHQVLEFLEPVRGAPRRLQAAPGRPYGASLSDTGELRNLGCVTTESFLRDLDTEWSSLPLHVGSNGGMQWVLAPLDPERRSDHQIGLRHLGTSRLKGLEPVQLAEVVVLDEAPSDATPLPPASSLVEAIHRLGVPAAAGKEESSAQDVQVPPELCAVSVLENPQVRTWYLGMFDRGRDALVNAFHVPLQAVEVKDGEPFEAWLFRRRGELAMLYHGLRRHDAGVSVPLEQLRLRDGYFLCLLSAPHRS